MLFPCLEHSASVPASSSLSFVSVLKHPFFQEAFLDSTMVLIHTAQPPLAIYSSLLTVLGVLVWSSISAAQLGEL